MPFGMTADRGQRLIMSRDGRAVSASSSTRHAAPTAAASAPICEGRSCTGAVDVLTAVVRTQ